MIARRSILAGVFATMGAGLLPTSAGAVPGVGDDFDCEDETEIVIAKRGDEAIETENVSTVWDEHRQYVESVRAAFPRDYPLEETDWLVSVGITAIDEEVCDMRQMALSLGVEDASRAYEELGDSYQGVPLVVQERGEAVALDAAAASEDTALPGFGIIAGLVGICAILVQRHHAG